MTDLKDILLNKNTIFADSSGERLSCILSRNSAVSAQAEFKGGALENIVSLTSQVLQKSNTNASDISMFALCLGTGSILGIRANSAAFSTMRAVAKNAILATWNLLDVYAEIKKSQGLKEFSIVCPSRKNYANALCLCADKSEQKEILSADIKTLPSPVFYINQRPCTDKNFENLCEIYFDAAQIFEFLKTHTYLLSVWQNFETPDAITLAKREYVKWNSHAQA